MTDRPRAILDIGWLTPQQRLDLIAQLWDSLTPEDIHLSLAQSDRAARPAAGFAVDATGAAPSPDAGAGLDRRSQ